MRWLGVLVAAALFLAAVAVATATWLLATDGGMQLLAGQLSKRIVELEIEGVQGNLLRGVHIDSLSYRGVTRVELHALAFELDLWPLIDLQGLHVERFSSDRMSIQSPPVVSAPPQSLRLDELRLPSLPLPVYLYDATIEQFAYEAVVLSDIHLAGAWTKAGLQISDLRLTREAISIDGRVALASVQNQPLHVDLAMTWFMDEQRGRLTAQGPITQPTVRHRFNGPTPTPILSEGRVFLGEWPALKAELTHAVSDPRIALSTQISGTDSRWRIAASGRVMDYPVSGVFDIDLGETLEIAVSQGILAEVLTVNGEASLGDTLRVQLNLASEDIAPLALGVSGDFVAAFEWVDGVAELDIKSQRLASDGFEILLAEATAKGSPQQFAFNTAWQGGRIDGVAYLAGEQTRVDIHRGAQLTYADFTVVSDGAFSVRRNGPLWSVTPHCWSGFGEICIDESELSETAVFMRGRLDNVRMAAVNELLPLTFAGESRLSGEWTWQGGSTAWQATTNLATHDLNFSVQERVFDWLPDMALTATVAPAAVSVQAIASQPGLSWQASMDADGWTPDSVVRGELHLEVDAATLPEMHPALRRFEGSILADADISGALNAPLVSARGTWRAGALQWLEPSLELSAIDLQWRADPDGWQLQGTAQSEQGGALSLQGSGDGYDLNANVEGDIASTGLTLQSDLWDVTAIPSAHVVASEGNVSFEGVAHIPKAKVTVKTLPSALPKPVADVRVRGRPDPVAAESPSRVQGNLKVSLGDDVRLDLLALAVRLQGEVVAQISGTEVVALHGELTVADGSLNASGQSLKVKEGRIVFSGDPTQPYVDLIATRDIKDYSPPLEVGLRISGRTDALKTSVYSMPAMNETRALSFLVLGRDFNEASEADSNLLLSAAISLGLMQSEGVVEQLRGVLGLDELAALAAEQNDVAIVAGKRITEDLYVRYSYNALSAVSALIIRYHLSDRWRLEATNDVNSSMDLLYEFSR